MGRRRPHPRAAIDAYDASTGQRTVDICRCAHTVTEHANDDTGPCMADDCYCAGWTTHDAIKGRGRGVSPTPLRPDPEVVQAGRDLRFETPLDDGIREIVLCLIGGGVETFESCEGGRGHAFPEPTVRFEGTTSEGLRALAFALEHGLPVFRLRRVWGVIDGMAHGPWWEMTFLSHKEAE